MASKKEFSNLSGMISLTPDNVFLNTVTLEVYKINSASVFVVVEYPAKLSQIDAAVMKLRKKLAELEDRL